MDYLQQSCSVGLLPEENGANGPVAFGILGGCPRIDNLRYLC